jgi:hypothetical protein
VGEGVIGYGAMAISMEDNNSSRVPTEDASDSLLVMPSPRGGEVDSDLLNASSKLGAGLSLMALDAVEFAGSGGTIPICSFSFFLYRSFSFKARSRSLLSPRIIARCLSTSLQSCEFCAAMDCFSFSIKRIASSADPAACIKD